MRYHLTRDELIDSLDGTLPPPRQTHADACATCAAERDALAEMLRDVGAVDIPEPSPLFWDHLSARIRESIAREPAPDLVSPGLAQTGLAGGWLSGWGSRWALAMGVLALCAGLGWVGWSELRRARSLPLTADAVAPQARGSVDDPAARTASPDAATRAHATAPGVDASAFLPGGSQGDHGDHEWALMMRMAEEVAWDDGDAPSMDVRPATVERALSELTSDDRRTLVQLVQADLARPPS